jgi:hypothetical protein
MPTVIGATKADFDRKEMGKRGQLKQDLPLLDEQGLPLVVYRGGIANEPIKTEGFKPGSLQLGPGAYFGSKGIAEEFAKYRPDGVVKKFHLHISKPFDETQRMRASPSQMKTLKQNLLKIGVPPVHVNELDQPYRGSITNLAESLSKKSQRQGNPMTNWEAADHINDAIKKAGFDGIIADWHEGGQQYVAFSKNQIKHLKDELTQK